MRHVVNVLANLPEIIVLGIGLAALLLAASGLLLR